MKGGGSVLDQNPARGSGGVSAVSFPSGAWDGAPGTNQFPAVLNLFVASPEYHGDTFPTNTSLNVQNYNYLSIHVIIFPIIQLGRTEGALIAYAPPPVNLRLVLMVSCYSITHMGTYGGILM